jgi:hypothetical protein
VLLADTTLQRSQQPTFEQCGDSVWPGHENMSWVRGSGQNGNLVLEALRRQLGVPFPAICLNNSTGSDNVADEAPHALGRDIRHVAQANAPKSTVFHLYSDGHNGLLDSLSTVNTGFLSTNVALVYLHRANESVPSRADHGASKLVEPRPSGPVTPKTEYPLKAHRVGAVLLAGQLPRSEKPKTQRFSGAFENGASRYRDLLTALGTKQQSPTGSPGHIR